MTGSRTLRAPPASARGVAIRSTAPLSAANSVTLWQSSSPTDSRRRSPPSVQDSQQRRFHRRLSCQPSLRSRRSFEVGWLNIQLRRRACESYVCHNCKCARLAEARQQVVGYNASSPGSSLRFRALALILPTPAADLGSACSKLNRREQTRSRRSRYTHLRPQLGGRSAQMER